MFRCIQLIPHAATILGLIVITQLISIDCGSVNHQLPCDFSDSINITDGDRQEDNSIIFDNITFTTDQYGYVKENDTDYEYPRGCICNVKQCVRLCCPYGEIYTNRRCQPHDKTYDFEDKVATDGEPTKNQFKNKRFSYVRSLPCRGGYKELEYRITKDGHAITVNETEHKIHHKYCLLNELDSETDELNVSLFLCANGQDQLKLNHRLLPFFMLMSVPFIVATILVYLCLPELRNLHGKCLLCYLMSLAIGYLFMATLQLNGYNSIEDYIRYPIAYITYFSFMSAFLWLTVISFDLWWIFRSTHGVLVLTEKKRFFLYMLFAWGIALLFTIIAFAVDSSSIPEHFKTGIGVQSGFLKNDFKTQLFYFYLPLSVFCTINLIFFILTALRIRKAQQELKKVTAHDESTRHRSKLNSDKDSFTLYLRLFIVMGVTWIMEAISFLVDRDGSSFIFTDCLNCVQGVLIFILFVMKRRVLRLIKTRWHDSFGKATTHNGSVATNSTSATIPPSSIGLNHMTCDKTKGSVRVRDIDVEVTVERLFHFHSSNRWN